MSIVLSPPVSSQDHARGGPRALVTLVEYGDYQCPYCSRAHTEVAKLLEIAKGRARYIFRNFPLVSIHDHAMAAAEAAEAAGTVGQFWAMHDWIFTHQQSISPEALEHGARSIGIPDLGALINDDVRARVASDIRGGKRSGVTSTPSFFCDGAPLESGYTAEDLLAAITRAEQMTARPRHSSSS